MSVWLKYCQLDFFLQSLVTKHNTIMNIFLEFSPWHVESFGKQQISISNVALLWLYRILMMLALHYLVWTENFIVILYCCIVSPLETLQVIQHFSSKVQSILLAVLWRRNTICFSSRRRKRFFVYRNLQLSDIASWCTLPWIMITWNSNFGVWHFVLIMMFVYLRAPVGAAVRHCGLRNTCGMV